MNKNKSWFTITFEWNSLVKDLIRNFWAIVLAAIIAWMGIQVVEKSIYTPTYTSSAILVVRSKGGTSGLYSSLSSSMEMATIFTKVFQQNSMKKRAAENIGLKTFDGKIKADVNGATNLMNLTVEATDPELAFRLLTSVLEVYPEISDAVFTDAVIDIISAPHMPFSPSNSVLTRYRNHIVLVAMLLEAALIVMFSLLRETVKEEKGFSDKIDSSLIATVAHEKVHLSLKEKLRGKKRSMLINDAYSSLRFTEDYQRIATKLEYMNKKKDKKVFVITSVSENEGKSTVAANTSLALVSRGYRVALVDLDLHKPSLHKIFDYTDDTGHDFSEVLEEKIPLSEYSFSRYRKSGLLIAFSKKCCDNSEEIFAKESLAETLGILKEKMDFVIIDTPPTSVTADAVTLSSVSDGTLLVVRTDKVDVQDINDAIFSFGEAGGSLEGCILNDVYKSFTLFGQMGSDETGYNNGYYKGYSKYGRQTPYIQGEGFTED